jgi:membrane protease YdiL (CAAX protease family)
MKGRPFHNLGFLPMLREHRAWFLYSAIVLLSGILMREYVIESTEIVINAGDNIEKVLIILGLAVFGPILEEILFRGYLQARMDDILKERYPWISIFITAALFSVFHFQYAPLEMLYIFGVGVFLSLMKHKTRSLWFPIIFHTAGNLYAVLMILL